MNERQMSHTERLLDVYEARRYIASKPLPKVYLAGGTDPNETGESDQAVAVRHFVKLPKEEPLIAVCYLALAGQLLKVAAMGPQRFWFSLMDKTLVSFMLQDV